MCSNCGWDYDTELEEDTMSATSQEFRREAQETLSGMGIIAGTVCIVALLLIGGIGVVMVWAALQMAQEAVRP